MADTRQSALRLRRVTAARQEGATWTQVAPLLGCTDGKAAKRAAHLLERELKPVAARIAAARRLAEQIDSQ
jgi:hypothetical protein